MPRLGVADRVVLKMGCTGQRKRETGKYFVTLHVGSVQCNENFNHVVCEKEL
jgi:hypothetical protein